VPEETAASVKSLKTYGKDAPMTTSSLKNRRRQDIDRTRGQFDDTLGQLTHKIDVPARIRDKVHDTKESVRVKPEEVRQQGLVKAEEARQQAQAEEAKRQAQAKAEQAKQRAQAEQAKQQAQAQAEQAKQQAQAQAEQAKQQAQAQAEQAKQQAQAQAEQATHQVHDSTEAVPAEANGVARQATGRLTDQVLAELPSPVAERIEPLTAPARQWPLLNAAVAVGVLLVMLFLRHLLRRNR
jgi:membrane protein involved in colicin uptake